MGIRALVTARSVFDAWGTPNLLLFGVLSATEGSDSAVCLTRGRHDGQRCGTRDVGSDASPSASEGRAEVLVKGAGEGPLVDGWRASHITAVRELCLTARMSLGSTAPASQLSASPAGPSRAFSQLLGHKDG